MGYVLHMKIVREETKFSNLPHIVVHLERGRGGIKNQAGLFNVPVSISSSLSLSKSICI